jgi:hypothetical protein
MVCPARKAKLIVDPPSLVELLHHTADSLSTPIPDFASSSATHYLAQLSSRPLTELSREPSTITSETFSVESELTNLCFREYSTFISVHQCSQAVQSAFDDFEGSLGRLLDSVPALEDECRSFTKRTSTIFAGRATAALVQEHQNKLLDLLEIPHLMETCVRNGYYQEAMELASHTGSLGQKYHDVALVEDVAKEVEGVKQMMLSQLLALLREPVKLPPLVKAVSYLRRLDVFDESTLGLVFLTSRLHNYHTALAENERERGEPARYLRKYVDLFREHVYDIIAQYTSIFQDRQHLEAFAGECIDGLVQIVESQIPRIANDPASMSSILVQLGYCSLSFSRVGLDFSSLVVAPFTRSIRRTYEDAIATATATITATFSQGGKSASSPVDVLVSPEQRSIVLGEKFTTFSPALANFPPLALFVNAHLAALNVLRLLAPCHLLPALVLTQSDSLVKATSAALQYLRTSTAEYISGDRPGHRRTPSSPRAHLLRRSTETLLTPEIRLARRREALRLCVVFAEVWDISMEHLARGLSETIYGVETKMSDELRTGLDHMASWAGQHKEKVSNGGVHPTSISEEVQDVSAEPKTPVRTAITLPDDVEEASLESDSATRLAVSPTPQSPTVLGALPVDDSAATTPSSTHTGNSLPRAVNGLTLAVTADPPSESEAHELQMTWGDSAATDTVAPAPLNSLQPSPLPPHDPIMEPMFAPVVGGLEDAISELLPIADPDTQQDIIQAAEVEHGAVNAGVGDRLDTPVTEERMKDVEETDIPDGVPAATESKHAVGTSAAIQADSEEVTSPTLEPAVPPNPTPNQAELPIPPSSRPDSPVEPLTSTGAAKKKKKKKGKR